MIYANIKFDMNKKIVEIKKIIKKTFFEIVKKIEKKNLFYSIKMKTRAKFFLKKLKSIYNNNKNGKKMEITIYKKFIKLI